jgi:hypothetical protein
MMTEEYKEEQGVSIEIDPEGWPEDLAGILINGKAFYIVDGIVTITGDPIWKFGVVADDD